MPSYLQVAITGAFLLLAYAVRRVEVEEDAKKTWSTAGAREEQRPLLFVHIHKSAGSHMCEVAKVAEKVVEPNANCNWSPYDDFENRGKVDLSRTCEQRSAYFETNLYTYGQIEREIRDADLCHDDFRYGVLLREPLARTVSHMSFEHMDKEWLLTDFKERLAKAGQLLQTEEASPQEEANFRVVDNYQVRILADALNVPAGGVTQAHLDLAKQRLARFEVVGVVEALGELESRTRILQGLGWVGRVSDDAFASHQNTLTGEHVVLQPEEEDFLRTRNAHDLSLYEWAQTLG